MIGGVAAKKFATDQPKTKGDYAFILHMIETLKPTSAAHTGSKKGARMGVVVPHGVLFRGSTEGTIRQKLIDENLLDCVIGLPEKLFYGTGIPAAILLFKKHKTDNHVLFIDASNDYKTGKNQNLLAPEHIQKILSAYQHRASIDKYAYLATHAEIKENDYNLNIPRYVDTFEEEAEIDLNAVRAERLHLRQTPTIEMLMHLDNFKSINDQYCHMDGDRVLRGIAENAMAHLRDGDIFARFGGEECALLLPRASGASAAISCREE